MAICRALGGRSLTTCPPIRTSPAVGRSSPAIIRSSVVLPDPDGPSSTRYSPSSVRRSIPSTAGVSVKTLRTSLVSTTAMASPAPPGGCAWSSGGAADEALLAPLRVDWLDGRLRLGHGVLGGHAVGGVGHHVRDHEGGEDLALGRVGGARVADVDAPALRVLEQRELVGWLRAEGVVVEPAGQLLPGGGVLERGEVVQLGVVGDVVRLVGQRQQELLGGVHLLGELGDDVAAHHVLGDQRRLGAPQRRPEEDVVGHRRVGALRAAVGGDRVEDVVELARDQPLVVGGGGPAEDLVGHALLEQLGHVVDRVDHLGGVDHHVLLRVLDRPAERPHQAPGRHVGVDLLRHADADRDALAPLELGAAAEQLVIGGGPVRQADLAPEALAVVARVGRPGVPEAVVLVGGRVEAGELGEANLVAVLADGLLDDVADVDHARLQRRRRHDPLDQVVALAGVDLGGGAGGEQGVVDVVDGHGDAVVLAPLLGPAVEPGVVAGDEMAPLQDPELLPALRAGGSRGPGARRQDARAGARGGECAGGPQEFATRDFAAVFRHGRLLVTITVTDTTGSYPSGASRTTLGKAMWRARGEGAAMAVRYGHGGVGGGGRGRGMLGSRMPSGPEADRSLREVLSDRQVLRRAARLFRPYRLQVAIVTVAILVTAGLGVANPLLIRATFDKALFVPGGPRIRLLVTLVSLMIAIPVVSSLVGVYQSWLTNTTGQSVMRDLRATLYAHLQSMPLRFFTATRTGEIQSRLANDVGGLQVVITDVASSVLSNLVILLSTLVAMLVLSWQLTVLSLFLLPLFVVLTRRVGRARRRVTGETQEALAEMSATTEETLSVSGVLLAKVFGRQKSEAERYGEQNEDLASLQVRQQMIGRSFFAVVSTFFSITPALVYLVAGLTYRHGGQLSPGTLVAFTTLQARLFMPIGQVLQISTEVASSLALFSRIFDYLDMHPDIVDAPDAATLPATQVRGEVGLDQVWFSYDATRGRVLLDGHDVRKLTLSSLSDAIGMVTQESYLFHASVRRNLMYARPEATEEQLVAAATAASIHDRITELEHGYDTVVGKRGYRLSGGEKQRLAIARVVLKDPRVLILDEATSSLDTTSERIVQAALQPLLRGRTTIALAHRLSTILAADVIFVLDRGRLIESGSHADLLAHGCLYRNLYDQHFGGGAVEARCHNGLIMSNGQVISIPETGTEAAT